MKNDPCFKCVLPECDDRSPRCLMRQLANNYHRKRQAGAPIQDQEREAANAIFHIWKLDRMAQAAEGILPYKRWDRENAKRREARP